MVRPPDDLTQLLPLLVIFAARRRAESTGGRPVSDEVFLEGMCFYGYHGVNPEERAQGQRFVVDVTVGADLRTAGLTDDFRATINYSQVYRGVKDIVEGDPKDLIEAVAEEIASWLLRNHPLAESVIVTVRKPEAPIKGAFLDAPGVRIHRTRGLDRE